MTRRRPRYTPDPPPRNATMEQLLTWANVQFQRIEDYWPADSSERIAALEELQTLVRQTGLWQISGQSNIRFEGTVVQDAILEDNAFLYVTGAPETATSTLLRGIAIDSDSSDNFVILCDERIKYGTAVAYVAKFDINGNVLWQKSLYKSGWTTSLSESNKKADVKIDSNGDVIVALSQSYTDLGALKPRATALKLNGSTGAISWQQTFATSGDGDISFSAISLDPNDNIYISGTAEDARASDYDAIIVKLNPSGSVTFSTGYYINSNWGYVGKDVSYKDGSLYLSAYAFDDISAGIIAKLGVTGAVSWCARVGITGSYNIGYGSVADDSGNAYLVWNATDSSRINGAPYMAKYNSSGTFQWAIALPSSLIARSVNIDQEGNPYVTGVSSPSGSSYVVKIDPEGDAVFDRYIEHTNGSYTANMIDVSVTAGGSALAVGYLLQSLPDGNELLVVKLPEELAATETVGVLEHGDASLSVSSVTPDTQGAASLLTISHSFTTSDESIAAVDNDLIEDLTYWDRT